MKRTGLLFTIMLILSLSASTSASAQNINIPNKTGPMGLQVNTLTGNIFLSRNDFYVAGRGFPLSVAFCYNSVLYNQNNGYGKGWSFGCDIKYKKDSSDGVKVSWGDGREDYYEAMEGSNFKSPTGFFYVLSEYQPGKLLLLQKDGLKYFFDNNLHRRITRMEDRNGNFVTFNYTDTLLTSIANGAGQSLSFTYTNGKLTTATDAVSLPARIYTYTYDDSGNLIKVTDPLNNVSKYSYLINGPMKTITDKNNNTVDIVYFNNFSASELIGCNRRLSFSYDTTALTSYVTEYLSSGVNQVTKYGFKKSGSRKWLSSVSGNCCGFDKKFEYDENGNKIKETDAKGNISLFTYDSRGNLLTSTDALNQVVTYTYTDAFNKVASMTDEAGATTTMSYDSHGNLIELKEPGNLIYTVSYNSNGDISTSTDPKGNTFTYNYDVYGSPSTITGPNGYTATLAFDARGNLLSTTDARGNTTMLEYDLLDRLKKIVNPVNNNVRFNYDAESNLTSLVNENNEISTGNYDASNRMVEITDARGKKAYSSFDAMGNITSYMNELGNASRLSYDSRNRLVAIADAEGNRLTAQHDPNGNVTSISYPNGQIVNYTYDQLDRITAMNDGSGLLATIGYDKKNNITRLTNGSGAVVTAEYDSLNRMKKTIDALGNSASITYDKNSNITSITDRNGFTSHYTYDNLDRLKSVTDNNGFIITAGYDVQGNIVSLTDQNNNTTDYTFDSLNRVKRTSYPDGKYTEYGYDSKGNIISKRLTDGNSLQFSYDALNRLISKTLPDGQVYTYTYDDLGRIISATNNTGTVTLTYDALNRITSETYNGRTVTYSYNIGGRIHTTLYPDGSTVTKNYDTRNRLTGIAKNNVVLVSYHYNNLDQLIGKTFGNGVTTNIQYDFANRLTGFSTSNGNIQHTSFLYDSENKKIATIRLNDMVKSEQFTYDSGYRLKNFKRGVIGNTPVIENSYNYDAAGNRVSANLNGINTSYTVNNLNQLISKNDGIQNINFTYDNNGNLTYDGHYYKTYDAEQRLIRDSSSPSNVQSYKYDAFNRRVIKTVNDIDLHYTFSGLEPIEERDNTGTILNNTIFSNFLSPVVNDKSTGRFYYHQNELNSVEAITNENGRLIEKYEYDVYGKTKILDSLNNPINASLTGNRFGFTGQVFDNVTGSYQFHFRDYNPETGLFNQRDLIGYGDGMGLYQYVQNDPANGIDPLGLTKTEDPCAHDKDKVRFITNRMILDELARMRKHADANGIHYKDVTIFNFWYTTQTNFLILKFHNLDAGLQADSKFYETLLSQTHGSNKFYFDGAVQPNYVVNYYFTAHAMAAMGTTPGFIKGQVSGWDHMKAGRDAAKAGWDGKSPVDAWNNRLVDNANKVGNGQKGYDDFMNYEKGQVVQRNPILPPGYEYKSEAFGDWWPVINPKTGELGYEFFPKLDMSKAQLLRFKEWYKEHCPQNGGGGSQNGGQGNGGGASGSGEVLNSADPNEIIGPVGIGDKQWVSIKDRLPYSILFENSKSATAPAKFVKITAPVHEKMDAAGFQLGSFGFNSLAFAVPPGAASFYQRLDCRDSLDLYVDVTAGYDQLHNQAFWEFQSIDPLTLLPPADPLKGFLLKQDSANALPGHGFVNFSIKPISTAHTLDSILARADIIFDSNDTIPTNIAKNTIDALPPVSSITGLTHFTPNTEVSLHYTGADDAGGSGVKWYSIYVSDNDGTPDLYISNFSSTDTTFIGVAEHSYKFYISATDSTGNIEALKLVDSVRIASGEVAICPNGSTSFDSKMSGISYQWQVDTGAGFTNVTNGGVYSGATTAILAISNAPTTMYGYQYRCMVNGSSYSNIFLLKFSMTWEGTISTAWENPANWSCNSLPDGNTDVIVNGGKANYPQLSSNVSVRTLRMNPGSSGTVNPGFSLQVLK